MGRLFFLVGICVVILGGIMTFHIPLDWLGHLPGDFTYEWEGRLFFIPVTSSLICSAFLSIILFIFAKH